MIKNNFYFSLNFPRKNTSDYKYDLIDTNKDKVPIIKQQIEADRRNDKQNTKIDKQTKQSVDTGIQTKIELEKGKMEQKY